MHQHQYIFKQLLSGYEYNPFIIAIKNNIQDYDIKLRHLKYAVYKLENKEIF